MDRLLRYEWPANVRELRNVIEPGRHVWVERPMCTQVIYCLDSVPALVKARPELTDVEPFKTVLNLRVRVVAVGRLSGPRMG